MNCAGSNRVESSKGFSCRNMGDVLGKDCEKEDSSLTQSVGDVLRDEAEGAISSELVSESDSEKDLDSDEDLSWLLPINSMKLGSKNCRCEGCLKLFESYNSDKKNAKLLHASWKEFRNYLRNVYINSPLEAIQKNENFSFEHNERLHEIVQVMRLCDPYQLFEKIEDELCSVVLEARIRQLDILKNENNPALAEEFIAGLIEEYVRLLSSALQLSPTIEKLLGPQLQRFGLTWEILNKQLYRSLVYNHIEVQQNLYKFIEQLRKMLPLKDDIYHELVHQYLALDGEMTLIGSMWKNVEPLIQEYRALKSKENEKLNNLLDAMKDFFSNKICSAEEETKTAHNKINHFTSNDAMQYCANCMTRRGCPCDECTVSHMMSCEDILMGMDSPLEDDTPIRSRSPLQRDEVKDGKEVEEQQSCECHACTMPPPDLMDCSVAFNQSTAKNPTHGEGFQLYPHIHGTTSEAENVSNIYGSLQTPNDSVYSHLYNTQNHSNSVENSTPQVNGSLRDQLVQAIVSIKMNSQLNKSAVSPPPPPPPPPPSQESTPLSKNPPQPFLPPSNEPFKNSVSVMPEKREQIPIIKKPIEQIKPKELVKVNNSENTTTLSPKTETKKNSPENKIIATKENGITEKPVPEKPQAKAQTNSSNKANGCVISGLCGKCCLKHGSNCLKMSGCNKGTDKHLAAMGRLGLSGNSNSRTSLRCPNGKDDPTQRTAKSHSCNKTKHQETVKKVAKKRNLENDESTSPEDSCTENGLNSNSVSTQKDPRHCDCCYCEVFGHGVPSVAPVSRNYQEMRERLRLRLNMKKSAKCKALQTGQTSQPTGQKIVGSNIKPPVSTAVKPDPKKEIREQDLDSLLNYIEGKKSECKDAKKAAKRARQKQKKLEKKEKLIEEEEERKRLEAVKRQVTISLVNDNKRSQTVKQNPPPPPQPPKPPVQSQRFNQPQTLNLSGLRSLVEKSDPNAVPKMVTIRRVMAPFSSEPTVTITLKGSTPDKDKVLFMLKNGTEAVPMEEEEPVSKKSKKKKKKEKQNTDWTRENYDPVYQPPVESKKNKKKEKQNTNYYEEDYEPVYREPMESKKKKKKEKQNTNYYEEDYESFYKQQTESKKKKKKEKQNTNYYEEDYEQIYEPPAESKKKKKKKKQEMDYYEEDFDSVFEPPTESKKKKKKKNKNSEPEPVSSRLTSSKSYSVENLTSGKNKSKNSKNSVNSSVTSNVKSSSGNKTTQNSKDSKVQSQNSKSQKTSNSKTDLQKNSSVLKSQNQEPVSKTNKNNNSVSKKSVQNVNQSNSVSSSKSSVNVKGAGVNNKGVKNNGKNQTSNNETSQKVKNSKNQVNLLNSESQKKGKKQRNDSLQSISSILQSSQTKNKINSKTSQKNIKNINGFPESARLFHNVEISPVLERKENTNKKNKSNKKGFAEDVEANCKIRREKQDNGKVIINTPSYRLSEVLSSIAPSPPPKEEINLENLRLPPGITITKIEGPIQKPIKPSIQPSQLPKPSPPIVMATPTLKPNPPPGNVIVVDTGRLKEVVKENSRMMAPPVDDTTSEGKKKKKKNKKQAENFPPTIEVPMNQSRFGAKVPKSDSLLNKRGLTVLSSMDARKMVPNLENQQATIIKTSDNMVTIRSPALQQAMNIHAYQNGQAFRSGINGYNNMNLFNEEVSRINDKFGKLKLAAESDNRLTRQMRNLSIKDGRRANELLAQAVMAASSQDNQGNGKKKKKKKKKSGVDREVEPVESVFQPKDIDLENGDIDDDERELEAFKRFCLQSIPPERKNKVKVNLNIKDIVLKKKSSAIGCS